MSSRRSPGPHVAWAGVVVRMDDGTSHAFEFRANMSNFVTADIIFVGPPSRQHLIVKIEGLGTWWTEGEDIASRETKPRELASGQSTLEGTWE